MVACLADKTYYQFPFLTDANGKMCSSGTPDLGQDHQSECDAEMAFHCYLIRMLILRKDRMRALSQRTESHLWLVMARMLLMPSLSTGDQQCDPNPLGGARRKGADCHPES